MMKTFIGFLGLCAGIVLTCGALRADSSEWQAEPDASETPTTVPTPNQASDASFDKRLPPVLPGEIVSDSGGKMKVWSTAGPVPVASPPEPWNPSAAQQPTPGPIGVIVDQRGNVQIGTGQTGTGQTQPAPR